MEAEYRLNRLGRGTETLIGGPFKDNGQAQCTSELYKLGGVSSVSRYVE